MRCKAWLLGLISLSLIGHAGAMSLRQFRALELSDKRGGEAFANYYLVGTMEGVMEANGFHARAGAQPLMCLNARRLEPRMARALFDAELARYHDLYEADMGVPLVMTNALANAYPCD